MSAALDVWLEGIGFWAPGLPDWPSLRAHMDGQPPRPDAPDKPDAALLAPAERRRAPAAVRLSIEAAGQAVQMSGRSAGDLPSVFVSAHGDATIMDYMCRTLAAAPRELSPTRFHNSVHNAAAGYWTIATGCMRASSAVCANTESFGAGLLEAMTLAVTDREPVLLVASDVPGDGPLREVVRTRTPMGNALVLAPERSAHAVARLRARLTAGEVPASARASKLQALVTDNACGDALRLLETLVAGTAGRCALACGPGLHLEIDTDILT